MAATSGQTQNNPTAAAPSSDATQYNGWKQALAQQGTAGRLIKNLLTPLASLRMTVVLFVLAIVLVFSGTLAQIDEGIWTVVSKYFRSIHVWIPFQIFANALIRFGLLPQSTQVPGGFPFPGGWLIGGLLLLNLVAAHAVRFKLAWKRSGILLIHTGLIVLMLSEFVTGLFAVEARMTIAEGESVNYVDVTSEVELALIDRSNPNFDDVIVIPESILRKEGLIRHELLPVDIVVQQYMANSDLVPARKGGESVEQSVVLSDGQRWTVVERPEESGVDPNQREDAPAAHITFQKKGTDEPLGTYLVSVWFYPNYTLRQLEGPQFLTVDGKTYTVYLRFQRAYKPYTLHLIDFRHDTYIGTETPKDFSSVVRLTDPTRNEDRQVRIWMNHPLRYAGETFYQSSFLPNDRGTVLQVVRNPGWLLPYISCALVSGGMLVHFGMHLFGFLRRRNAR